MNLIITLFASLVCLLPQQHQTEMEKYEIAVERNFSVAGEKVWKIEYQDAQVLIESTVITYTDNSKNMNHERIVFRYTNRTTNKLKLSFGRKMIYNGVCYGCDKADKKYVLELNPLQTKEFSEENKDKTYYIFSKDFKQTITKTLDNFEITNIETIMQ